MLKFPTDITQKQMQWERSKQSKKNICQQNNGKKGIQADLEPQWLTVIMRGLGCWPELCLYWSIKGQSRKKDYDFFSPFSLTWQSQWCLLIASLYYWFKFWQWWALELWKKVSQENLEILETQKSYTGWKHPHKMLQEESNINLTALLNQIFSTSDFSS